ncbi:hypothetical protein CIG19_16070 [Enterobacterales bacterium CwR94]|nr:hypothetical protein CIG19_16070 [Enterobacterales bacterium CwR94]
MEKRRLWGILLPLSLALTGCAAPPPSSEVRQLHQQVGKLNKEMSQLTQQAAAVERQSMLNQTSTQGAWLLPAANTPVVLQSEAGDLRLSLSHVQMEANGTTALLHLRSTAEQPVPALTATVTWGMLDSATSRPLPTEMLSQDIQVPATLLPRSEATVSLRLSGYTPAQLGYVRVHNLLRYTQPAPVP